MGNKYSVVREEEEEAEYTRLVHAVQTAQRRARRAEVDLEVGLDADAPQYDTSPLQHISPTQHQSSHRQTYTVESHRIADPTTICLPINPAPPVQQGADHSSDELDGDRGRSASPRRPPSPVVIACAVGSEALADEYPVIVRAPIPLSDDPIAVQLNSRVSEPERGRQGRPRILVVSNPPSSSASVSSPRLSPDRALFVSEQELEKGRERLPERRDSSTPAVPGPLPEVAAHQDPSEPRPISIRSRSRSSQRSWISSLASGLRSDLRDEHGKGAGDTSLMIPVGEIVDTARRKSISPPARAVVICRSRSSSRSDRSLGRRTHHRRDPSSSPLPTVIRVRDDPPFHAVPRSSASYEHSPQDPVLITIPPPSSPIIIEPSVVVVPQPHQGHMPNPQVTVLPPSRGITALLEQIQSQEDQLSRLADLLENALVRQPLRTSIKSRSTSPYIHHIQKSVSRIDVSADGIDSILEKKADHDVKPYPNLPYAAGLHTGRRCSGDNQWQAVWAVYPLKVFRGGEWAYLKIQPHWDDEQLLRELSNTYDRLRTIWRKWFSLRSVGSMVMVLADHSFVYPQRVGTAGLSPSKNMRLRYFLHHPEAMRGRHEFLQVLTDNPRLGVEFVERWQVSRIAIAVLIPVIMSVIVGVVYSGITGDASTAFTIAGYMTSAYSVCLVLVGVLNLVEM
ncbi:hypothetical protein CERSUDRAFT_95895 [Gelatoporia subvermispora B]|uniref:Uncharacterized protein n=1 Tax=Ceriporiopsis subvermispora (strain B) TaxID=914234 RepID=M2QWT7_CERS8|nr:hypothetical protein CERSUDRAFT_95895 [Gelatoporia subvermispora B]